MVQQFTFLSQLKKLCLENVSVDGPRFCASLSQLTTLASLQLSSIALPVHSHYETYGETNATDVGSARTEQLMQTIAALPSLSSLKFSYVKCGRSPTMLGAATKLTSLGLRHCGISDYALNCILCGVKGLCKLEVADCHHITDSVLPVISTLQHLTSVLLVGTGVSEVGAQDLLGLETLRYMFAADELGGKSSQQIWDNGYFIV